MPGGNVTYDMLLSARVQVVDVECGANPPPAGPVVSLGDFVPPSGAVLFLVRRPG